MLNPIKKSFAYGAHTVTLETAEVARQAGGAVMVTMEDTIQEIAEALGEEDGNDPEADPLTETLGEEIDAKTLE